MSGKKKNNRSRNEDQTNKIILATVALQLIKSVIELITKLIE